MPEFSTRTLSESEALEVWACTNDAFRRLQPSARWSRSRQDHRCDTSCPLLCHREVYVCLESGAAHLCSEYTCPYTEEVGGEARVCLITAKSYGVDFQYSYEQGNIPDERRRMTRCVKELAIEPTPSPTGILASPSPESAAMQSPTAMSWETAQYERRHDMANRIAQFMQRDRPIDLDRRLDLARDVLDLHLLVQQFTPGKLPRRYDLDFHTFAVLDLMARGGWSMGTQRTYVHPQADVRDSIVPDDSALAMLRAPQKDHTRVTGILCDAFRAHSRSLH